MSEFWQQLSLASIGLWMLFFSLGMSAPRARNSGRESDNSTSSDFHDTDWACTEDASQTFDPFTKTLTVYQHSYFGQNDSNLLSGTLFSPVFSSHKAVYRKQEIVQRLHGLIKDLAWHLSAAGGRQFRTDWQPSTDELRDLGGAEVLLVSTIEEMASFSVSRSGRVQPDDQVTRFAAYLLGDVHPASNDSHAAPRDTTAAADHSRPNILASRLTSDRRRRSDLRPSSRNECVGLRGSLNCTRLATALSTLHASFVTFSERAGKGQFGNVLTAISSTVTGFPSERWAVEAFATYLTLLQVGGYAALHFALHVQNRTEEARQVTCVKNTRFQRQHAIFVSALQNASEVSKVSHIRREYEPYSVWQLGAGVEQGRVDNSQISALTGCQLYTTIASRLSLRCSFSKTHKRADPALWAFEAGPANWTAVPEGNSSQKISKKRRVTRINSQWREVTDKGEALCGLGLEVKDKVLGLSIKVCNIMELKHRSFLHKWRQVPNTNCTETLKKKWVEVDTRPEVTDLPGWVTGVRLYRNSRGRLALEMKRRFQLSETAAV